MLYYIKISKDKTEEREKTVLYKFCLIQWIQHLNTLSDI